MTASDFILYTAIFVSLVFGGYAIYRCWKDPERAVVEKAVFTFFIVICPFLGAMIFFRAQNSRNQYQNDVWQRRRRG